TIRPPHPGLASRRLLSRGRRRPVSRAGYGRDLRHIQSGRSVNATLIVRQENGRVTEFPVGKDEVKIGRTQQRNDLVLEDPAVSREHAAIRRDPFGHLLIDLGSVNGTLVNGEPLHGPRVLAPGDVVSIGNTTLTYRVETPEKREEVQF